VSNAVTEKIMEDAVRKAGLWSDAQNLAFPVITKGGVNGRGKMVHYLFNYASKTTTINYPFANGKELLTGVVINKNSSVALEPWGLKIVEEQ
jgi:beta-galactosidase